MNKAKLRVGIIGAGRIGNAHAETLATRSPDAMPQVIADVNRAAAEQLAARFGIPRVAGSAAEVLQDPNVDAVVICTSTDTHVDLIMAAAQAGKHIFCEKPIDRSLERIDLALAAVKQSGVQLQIGLNRRFDRGSVRVRKAIETGEIGTPYLLHITSRDPEPPPLPYIKVSGGMFLDMTIHDFDLARFLIGSDIEEVFTAASVRVDPLIGEAGDVDTSVIVLRFKNGVIGTIDNCRKSAAGYDLRVELLGSNGTIVTAHAPSDEVGEPKLSTERKNLQQHFIDRWRESYVAEIQAFIKAVLEGSPTLVTGADGRFPVVMAQAARKSHDEHRPVRLDEISQASAVSGQSTAAG